MDNNVSQEGGGGERAAENNETPLSPQHRLSNTTKEAWILHSLKSRRTEFLKTHQINAFVGTWNVNKRIAASSDEIAQWLGFVSKENNSQIEFGKLPELIILGFQEMEAGAEAFVYNNEVKAGEWSEAVEQAMGNARYSYSTLVSKQLIGMFIKVYARIDVLANIRCIQTASVGCGIMGMVGNKGAVAVRLVYMDTPVCLVCSHLAHGPLQLDRRNEQFHDLCKRLAFGDQVQGMPTADPLIPTSSLFGSGQATVGRPLTVFDSSYLLWFGDLNYRLAIDTEDMDAVIRRGEHLSLLGLDQLRIAMMNKQAFVGFEEADIQFAPTYKYLVGAEDEYDVSRRPSWCDRILWWTHPGCEGGIKSNEYTALKSLKTSDHKPVRSRISMDVWKTDVDKRQSVYLDVLRELDRYENECIPTAVLESTQVDFGDVVFGRMVRRQMKLSNSGQVPLEYSFIATPARESYAPEWLQISPDSGMLLPGQDIQLEFTVMVDETTSAPLSAREEDLADILVLHLTRGRDYFIQVQGNYLPSVFGMSLDVLVHCKKAVRHMTRAEFEQCLVSGQFSVPKCIWSMTDFLSRYAVERGYSLFYWPGDRNLAKKIKECLDLDLALDPNAILQWHADAENHVARTVVEEQSPRIQALAQPLNTQAQTQMQMQHQHQLQEHQQQQQQQRELRALSEEPVGRTTSDAHMASLMDQTLVSSTLHTGFRGMELIPNTAGTNPGIPPTTAEALERLSLNNAWGSSVAATAAAAPVLERETPSSGMPTSESLETSSQTDSEIDETSAAHTLLPSNVRSVNRSIGGTSSLYDDDRLTGSPLPETIGNSGLSAPHDSGIDTVASCLVELLQSLPEPLIPTDLYNACIEAGGVSRAAALEALEILPPGNLNVLVYLLAFLREAIECGATSAQRVAQVFGRVLLRPSSCDRSSRDYERAESFLMFLLRSHGSI
ncbi:hypothetical protein LPJ64_004731 [Coemansia asiatica]|uniref:Rho-GAP domain-containing protein n=1 Tax=Coemansia asiatica TaxID=1052880 RepID=A0A9W7XIK7_9FUNG|nr:hypothetical protein LPJ64_004731 [Coemansia asiatica]